MNSHSGNRDSDYPAGNPAPELASGSTAGLASRSEYTAVAECSTARVAPDQRNKAVLAASVLILMILAGTFYVKWSPYYHKAGLAATRHTLGPSIISGKSANAPAGWHAAWSYAVSYGKAIWQALVLGLLTAAGVQEVVPRDWLLRLFGSRRARSIAVGGAVAIPSMMCTCCAAPPAVSLARRNASTGAVLAYWLGNPVLNPATIVFMGFVLGWRWAALRIVVGLALVFGVATLAQRIFGDSAVRPLADAVVNVVEPPADQRPLLRRYITAVGKLAAVLLPEYVLIVLILGGVRAFLFPSISPAAGHSIWLILLLAVAGTLFAVPTAGEIPVVQSFAKFGLSAAGSGALMITLPAVSLPSLIMLGKAVHPRVLALTATSVVVFGLLTAVIAEVIGL